MWPPVSALAGAGKTALFSWTNQPAGVDSEFGIRGEIHKFKLLVQLPEQNCKLLALASKWESNICVFCLLVWLLRYIKSPLKMSSRLFDSGRWDNGMFFE